MISIFGYFEVQTRQNFEHPAVDNPSLSRELEWRPPEAPSNLSDTMSLHNSRR